MSTSPPPLFTISPTWQAAHPGAAAGVLALRNVANPPQHPRPEERKAALEQRLRDQFGSLGRAGLRALPPIRVYDAYYRRFEKTYHVQLQLESVALKGKPIPRVAALVEAMFMAELQNLLLTAGHDLDSLALPVHLSVAEGSERYALLNGQEQVLKAGDMFMADRQGVISSVIYGPDQRSRITPATRSVLFTVYAPPGIRPEAVRQHLHDLRSHVLLIAPEAQVELEEVYGAG